MNKQKITNVQFELISSTIKEYQEVQVLFEYKNKKQKHFVLIKKDNHKNYLKEAENQFYHDLENGKIIKSHHHWLMALTGVLGITTITFAALFVNKLLNSSGGGDVPLTDYATVTLDSGKDGKVESKDTSVFKYTIKTGSTFGEVMKELKYIGASKDGQDFLYWTIDGNRVKDDYVINRNTHLEAKYKVSQPDCITITTKADDATVVFNENVSNLYFSTDGTSWNPIAGPIVINRTGDQIYIKRTAETALGIPDESTLFECNRLHSVSGPLQSLINGITTGLPTSAFMNCFAENNSIGDIPHTLTSAENIKLDGIELSESCFHSMFEGCTTLVSVPDLPATTMQNYCYQEMFKDCSSIVEPPKISATTLATQCFAYLFQNCSSLVHAIELPIKDLVFGCYYSMFDGCVSLIEAPKLEATIMKPSCYRFMFNNCRSLKELPNLPATELAEYCYAYMFSSCYGVAKAQERLPATTLQPHCYDCMFNGCRSLQIMPQLGNGIDPLQTSESSCLFMFNNCVTLKQIDKFKTGTLSTGCYQQMFANCYNITEAPELPTPTMTNCYTQMFSGCSSLKVGETDNTEVSNKIVTFDSTVIGATNMFASTGGDFKGTPTANHTYYFY